MNRGSGVRSGPAEPKYFQRVRRINSNVFPPMTKRLVHRPGYNDMLLHQRHGKRTKYYFTSGHEHLGKAKNVNELRSPFIFPPCTHMFSYYQYWKTKKQKEDKERREKSFKKEKTDTPEDSADNILRRVRVDVDLEKQEAVKHKDLDKAIAITDVDPNYFTEVSGRINKKFSLLQYVDDLRNILKARLLAGERRDICINIQQQFAEEQRRMDKIKKEYQEYVKAFEDFLAKDHEKSMAILEEADKETKLTTEMSETKNQLTRDLGKIRLQLYQWEENWRLVKTCQKFLFQLSPMSWRIDHDWIYRTCSGESVFSATTEDIFGRFKMADAAASLEQLIKLFEEDIMDSGSPDIYFKDPYDLIRIFRAMETQNLNALTHLESLAAPMMDMAITMAEAEEQIKVEFDEIFLGIDELERAIEKTEERADNLREYTDYLIQNTFRDLVCSEEVLFLYVYIEDAYEACIAPNDAKLDSFIMMKQLEKVHEELNLTLDTLPHKIVTECEKEGFKYEMKAMKQAEDAARKFELMHRLLDALTRIMETPVGKLRQLKWRSPPIFEKEEEEPPPPEPTEEEIQYLTYFTDYCKQDDFLNFRSKFPDDFDLTFETKKEDIDKTSDLQLSEESSIQQTEAVSNSSEL